MEHSPAKEVDAFEYDAFISYSRQDSAVAEALERALERYRAPRDLGVHSRHLNVFRDVNDFTGSDYQASVERHLRQSRHLIVLCSPAARASRYVDDEVARFAAARTPEAIIPVLVDGMPNNEVTPETEARAAFPRELCAALPMPLAIPFDDFDPARDDIRRGRFEASWYTLLANLHGVSRAEVERRDRKRRRKRLATVVATTAAVIVGLATLSVIALIQRGEARRAQRAAEDRAAVALAGGVIDRSLESAALLLLEVEDPGADNDEALTLLARVATARGGWLEIARWSAPGATALAFSEDGGLLRVSGPDSSGFRDPWSGAIRQPPDTVTAFPAALHAADPAGRRRVEDADLSTPVLVGDARGDTLARLTTSQCVDRVFFGPRGRTVIGDCMAGGEVGIWDADTGTRNALLPGRVLGAWAMDAEGARILVGPPYSMGNRGRGAGIDVVEVPGGTRSATLELTGAVQAYAMSPSGRTIAALSSTGEVRVWSDEGRGLDAGLVEPGRGSVGPVTGPTSPSWHLTEESDHWRIEEAEGEGGPISLRLPRPEASWVPPVDPLRPDPVFDGDADAVFARGDGGRSMVAPDPMAWVWDAAGGAVLLEIPGDVRLVAFHPQRDLMATLVAGAYAEPGEPGLLTLWNHEAGTRIADVADVAAVGMAFDTGGGHLVLETPEGGRRRLMVSGPALQARLRARTPACLSPDERQRLLGESAADAQRTASACRRCVVLHDADWGQVRQGAVQAEGPWAAFRSCLIDG